MKKLLLVLFLTLVPSFAFAQCNGVFPNNTACGNITGASNTPRPIPLSNFPTVAGGTNGQIQYNNSGALGGFTASGDAVINTGNGLVTIQSGVVNSGKIAAGGVANSNIAAGTAGTVKGTVGSSVVDILASTILNTACTISPTTCLTLFSYGNILWWGAMCDGTTNDTTAIQAAFTAVYAAGSYGTVYIPPTPNGCLIKQQGSNTYALQMPGPTNIKGSGMLSNLKTDPSIPNTVDDLIVNVGTAASDWRGIVFENFSIGDEANWQPPSYQAYTRHGRRGLWFDSGTQPNGFEDVTIRNVIIGESNFDYSLYIDGQATTRFLIDHNQIYGGLNLPNDADFMTMVNNFFGGVGSFGIYINTPSAGHMNFIFNTVVAPGGLTIDSGTIPTIAGNYFEEIIHPITIGAFINIAGGTQTVEGAQVYDNYVNVDVNTTAQAVIFNNSSGHHLYGNIFNLSTARAAVSNVAAAWGCGYNTWGNASPHITGTAPSVNYGSC